MCSLPPTPPRSLGGEGGGGEYTHGARVLTHTSMSSVEGAVWTDPQQRYQLARGKTSKHWLTISITQELPLDDTKYKLTIKRKTCCLHRLHHLPGQNSPRRVVCRHLKRHGPNCCCPIVYSFPVLPARMMLSNVDTSSVLIDQPVVARQVLSCFSDYLRYFKNNCVRAILLHTL